MASLPLPWEWVGSLGHPVPLWTPPDPLMPPVPFPSLRAFFAHSAAPGLLQGSESLYQLQTRDPTTLTALEKWRNTKDGGTEGYKHCVNTMMLLCLMREAPGMCSTGTTPRDTTTPPTGSKLPSPWLCKWIYWISRAWVFG